MYPGLAVTRTGSHWMGTLDAYGHPLRVLLHIREGVDGVIDASMDNIDVGRMQIPVAMGMFQRTMVRFHVWSIGGLFEGAMTADGQTIEGTWRVDEEAQRLVLRSIRPSRMDGIWAGTLSHETMRLRLVFYIATSPSGPIATMKSCDQGDAIVPMTSVKVLGETFVLQADAISARFEGRLDPDFRAIEGTWNQSGLGLPFSLTKIDNEEELEVPRPQEPAAPFPYGDSEVRYRNDNAGFEIEGTLTVPEGRGPFPVVLLVAGSGPLDRNETMHGHRPFLVLADHLTRNGIAVLRADTRGIGGSGATTVAPRRPSLRPTPKRALRSCRRGRKWTAAGSD